MSVLALDRPPPQNSSAASRSSIPAAARLRHVRLRGKEDARSPSLSLDLAPGAIVAVVGRRGSGKSTLLRLLTGEQRASAGAEIEAPGPVELIGAGAQLLPWRRVWDSVAEGLPAGWRSASDAERIAAAVKEVGLENEARTRSIRLSDEDALRAALARALVRSPKLLLLDDVFRPLHARARAAIQHLLLSLWRSHRPAILLATDDLNEALQLADRVLALDDGRLVADIDVSLPRPRALIDPEFSALRSELLRILGHDFAVERDQAPWPALEVFL